MKRRTFFKTSAGASALASGMTGCGNKREMATSGRQLTIKSVNITGFTLKELREQYRYDLFDDFLPFLDKFVIDHEYGGFLSMTRAIAIR